MPACISENNAVGSFGRGWNFHLKFQRQWPCLPVLLGFWWGLVGHAFNELSALIIMHNMPNRPTLPVERLLGGSLGPVCFFLQIYNYSSLLFKCRWWEAVIWGVQELFCWWDPELGGAVGVVQWHWQASFRVSTVVAQRRGDEGEYKTAWL